MLLCETQNKQCYPSKAAAIRAALSYSKRRGHALRVYFHRDCKSFHLSSQARASVDNHTRRIA